MAVYQVLRWKGIPAQVRAYDGNRPVSKLMPEEFQEEIDRVAMVEGLSGTDAYLDQWEWSEKMEREGSVEEVLEVLISELIGECNSRK